MSPWALADPEDGREPAYRSVDEDTPLAPGEVVVAEHPAGKVWDAGLGALREKTAAERTREKKAARKAALSEEGRRLTEPMFAVGFASEEFQALTAARALGQPADPRLTEAVRIMGRVRQAYAEIDAIPDDDPAAERTIEEVTL